MQKNNSSVVIETTINAAVEKVWKAWTEPALIKKWFGSDPDGEVLKATLDVRQGGCFEIVFKDSDGTKHTCSGRYEVVVAFSELAFTWQWKSEPGVQSFINLLLTPAGNSTLMQFEHMNLASGSKHDYSKGWQSTFLKLERLVSSQSCN